MLLRPFFKRHEDKRRAILYTRKTQPVRLPQLLSLPHHGDDEYDRSKWPKITTEYYVTKWKDDANSHEHQLKYLEDPRCRATIELDQQGGPDSLLLPISTTVEKLISLRDGSISGVDSVSGQQIKSLSWLGKCKVHQIIQTHIQAPFRQDCAEQVGTCDDECFLYGVAMFKKGQHFNLDHYRILFLQCVIYKVLASILVAYINEHLQKRQALGDYIVGEKS